MNFFSANMSVTSPSRVSHTRYVCDACGRSYRHRASLSQHVLRVHSDDKRAYLCEVCGISFAVLQSLQRHRHSAHVELRRYPCSACGKYFASRYRRREHELICGCRGGKPYACKTCGEKFTIKSNLHRHEQMHTSPSFHECSACGLSFRRKHNMTTHVRRIHCAAKFECCTCGQKLRFFSVLMRHCDTHKNSVQSFVCNKCGKSFTKLQYFRMHQTVHAEKMISCVHCRRCFCRVAYYHAHRCKKLLVTA